MSSIVYLEGGLLEGRVGEAGTLGFSFFSWTKVQTLGELEGVTQNPQYSKNAVLKNPHVR